MKLSFTIEERAEPTILRARLARVPRGALLLYRWYAGALLRQDGAVCGAFDREHRAVALRESEVPSELTLEVEPHGLPASGLPSGPGLRWSWMQRARAIPLHARLLLASEPQRFQELSSHSPAAVGHAHLDVAWLWTNVQARRKFARTMANQVRYVEDDQAFIFAQSQPQLYAWLAEDQPALFQHVRALAEEGRVDASVAAMWVEPDCHAPSGESLLRQLAYGRRYAREQLGTEAEVCWLPDSFGFPSTLPTLLAHAGAAYFYTTKLRWNERTRFPYTRWWWEGPDGARLLAVLGGSYEGAATPRRIAQARDEETPLVVGYGDGGGGPTLGTLAEVREAGLPWTGAASWFARTAQHAGAALPTYRGELYLEYHRGTYTTNAALKGANAMLELQLGHAEELTAWCTAMRVAQSMLRESRADLAAAWRGVLTQQFHDVIAGTSIASVTHDALEAYAAAQRRVDAVLARAAAVLPREGHGRGGRGLEIVPPVAQEDGTWLLDNGHVRARVDGAGAIVALEAGGEGYVKRANVLRAFVDRPRAWEAWNLDAGYRRRPLQLGAATVQGARDGVLVRRTLGASEIEQHIAAWPGEPWVRVVTRVAWRERRTILRVEHTFERDDEQAIFGEPHGTLSRPVRPGSEAERAKFEAPGQRFCSVAGCAVFTVDRYGWSLAPGQDGGVEVGLSLLRGSTWPDPEADAGEHVVEYALVPHGGASLGELERAWQRFAQPRRPPLIHCHAANTIVVAVKPADDGEGVVVRVRECDGVGGEVPLEFSIRPLAVERVDGEERPVPGGALHLDDCTIRLPMRAFGLAAVRAHYPIKDF
ncbi:MAG: alpha-mannosidase [bacterium]|nr:alpha-mannosidase [bacterium]